MGVFCFQPFSKQSKRNKTKIKPNIETVEIVLEKKKTTTEKESLVHNRSHTQAGKTKEKRSYKNKKKIKRERHIQER